MSTIHSIYLGDMRTEATHSPSGAKVITDAPADNHGKGESFSPSDLFAASLAGCMLSCMGIAARTHHINIEGATCEVNKTMESNPRRITSIVVNFTFPAQYTAKEQKILEIAAHSCPISMSLHADLSKTVNFGW